MNILENFNELGNKLNEKFDLQNLQENFLNSNIGQIANVAIDMGLRNLLPDFIENEVIGVKDALIKGGIREGIDTAIQNTINFGKKILGIDNASFSSIQQAENAIEKGKLKENITNAISNAIEKTSNLNLISENVSNQLKDGKGLIMDNISTNVENEFSNEIKALEKIEKYIGNWEKFYNKKNVEGLTKEYSKIQKQMKKIMPLENIIKKLNKIETINELIKNNKNFDFSDVYLELASSF